MADIKTIEVDGVEYNINDATARSSIGDLSALETEAKGDLVAAINEAASSGGSSPVQYVESLDESNLTNLRDLETGTYVMYGYFRPYAGASTVLTFDNLQVNVVRKTAGTHVLVFSTLNSIVNFLEILVDDTASGGFTYNRTDISMMDLFGLIAKVGTLDNLTTTEKTSLVAAINEVKAGAGGGGSAEIPYFDLEAMGLPVYDMDNITYPNSAIARDVDLTDIIAALERGPIRVSFPISMSGATVTHIADTNYSNFVGNNIHVAQAVTNIGGEMYNIHLQLQPDNSSMYLSILKFYPNAESGTGGTDLPAYTEADYGKVLSATADGLVWVEQSGGSGGSVPSAEGVEF